MLDHFLNVINLFDQKILWGPWTMIFIASVSLYLTIKSRFFQMRKIPLIFRTTFGGFFRKSAAGSGGIMTPFQATSTALASTVGMGSIAGVATALSVGGPGAIFWMWLLAFISMITKTAEITLAVHYREVEPGGKVHGGPMYYIKKGLGWNVLARIFSMSMFVNAVFCASLLQSHTVGRAFLSSYGINPYLVTGLMAVTTAAVVIGGFKRIGRFCETLVPLMSVVYVLGGLILFFFHFDRIPLVFGLVFKHAFSPIPAAGGFAGAAVSAAIKNGMAKGMLSNEAGLGTAPMAHATADTPHPFKQGIWGAFEVFVVTFIICTITSFAVLSTGTLSSGQSGIELVITAFSTVLPVQAARLLLSFSILTFCLTTQIGFFIYYETSIFHAFGSRPMKYLRWFYFIPAVIFAGVADVDKLWVFANVAVGICAIPNLIAVLALSGAFFILMRDYLERRNKYATSLTDVSRQYVRSPRVKNLFRRILNLNWRKTNHEAKKRTFFC
ncbi:MAG: sodium:alanine symporter family protein [Candidatus Aminicenantes bacterium]|nr:sodium:alanine symporter family protein [Candidatus Aminicenantes bacterium]